MKKKTDDSPSISLSMTSSESEQSDLSTCSTNTSINATTNEIRAKVLKWGKKQNLNLVENQHFTITVKYHPSDGKKSMCIYKMWLWKQLHYKSKGKQLVNIQLVATLSVMYL